MASFADALRPFVFPGINIVQGRLYSGLQDWINKTYDYQTIDPLSSKSAFNLDVTGGASLAEAFAFDVNRLSAAAFESLLIIVQNPTLPKSTGWPIIQSYYAAFFAANALLRLFGVSFSQLDALTTGGITKLFQAYGVDNGLSLERGMYACAYDAGSKRLQCKSVAKDGGSHEAVWKAFAQLVARLSNDVLTVGLTTENQPVSNKLDELTACLNQGNGKAWLSQVRNKVNYQSGLGCWFPYQSAGRQYKKLFKNPREWLCDPMMIATIPSGTDDLVHVQQVCQFIVSFCYSILSDLSERCPTGPSFAQVGALRLLKETSARPARKTAS